MTKSVTNPSSAIGAAGAGPVDEGQNVAVGGGRHSGRNLMDRRFLSSAICMIFELRQSDVLEVLGVAVDLSRDVAVLDRGELRGETAQAHRDASRLRGGEQILHHRVVSGEVGPLPFPPADSAPRSRSRRIRRSLRSLDKHAAGAL